MNTSLKTDANRRRQAESAIAAVTCKSLHPPNLAISRIGLRLTLLISAVATIGCGEVYVNHAYWPARNVFVNKTYGSASLDDKRIDGVLVLPAIRGAGWSRPSLFVCAISENVERSIKLHAVEIYDPRVNASPKLLYRRDIMEHIDLDLRIENTEFFYGNNLVAFEAESNEAKILTTDEYTIRIIFSTDVRPEAEIDFDYPIVPVKSWYPLPP